MQSLLTLYLGWRIGSRVHVMAFRFSLDCQGQTVGSDCHTHWSEKDREPCPRSRGKRGDPSVLSHTGAGMRQDGVDSEYRPWTGAETFLQFCFVLSEPNSHHPRYKRTQKQQRIKRAEITIKIGQSIT